MPSTKSFEMLVVRQQPLTTEDWVELIEARRVLVKPHLDSFSLPTLGKVKCLRGQYWQEEELGEYRETSGDERFSCKTQGIFSLQPSAAMERFVEGGCTRGIKKVWGLTRAGKWIIATVSCVLTRGYKDRSLEVAEKIEIVEADVSTILTATKTPPAEIWQALGKALRSFADHRAKLYTEAQMLVRMVEVEEDLIRFVPQPESELPA